LGEVTEALKMYKECYKYYKNKNYRDEKYSVQFQNTLFAIADSYKGLKQIDSATFYNKYGYKEAKITHNEDFLYLFILNEGANLVIKKNYKAALDSIKKALPKMIAFKDEGNVLASYYYLGKAYEGLGQKDIAVSNYVKVDSIYKKRGFITPEFIGGYSFLISYYKDKGNQKKQLEYLTTYTKIDSDLQRHYKQMYKLLVQQYDIPHLFKDKEALIKSLKKDWTFYYCLLAVILLTAISLGIYGFYQRNLNKTYRTRFEKIIADTKYLNTTPTKVELAIPEEITKSKPLVVADDMAIQLLKKLDAFVNERGYLKSNITLQSLSKELSTNSTYLSYIINQYKEKNLVAYLNDLRINDAVMSLQKNSDLKKYTIQALANEFGFNNAESFSNAFHRKTGLKPSFFIKELEKQ
jgi:AraC-like DNA-binding protein